MSAGHEPSIQRAKYISEVVFLSEPSSTSKLPEKKKKIKPGEPTKHHTSLRDSRNSNKALASLVGHKTLVKAHLPCWSRRLALGLKNKEKPGRQKVSTATQRSRGSLSPSCQIVIRGSHRQRSLRGARLPPPRGSREPAPRGQSAEKPPAAPTHLGLKHLRVVPASPAAPRHNRRMVTERNNPSRCNLYVNNTIRYCKHSYTTVYSRHCNSS